MTSDFSEVRDSGERQSFDTGAVRDTAKNKGRYDLILSLPHMLYRLARHFENGAAKYGDDNWKKGIPLRRYIDSAFRHLSQYVAGNQDEDHLCAAIWNLLCHGETQHEIASGLLPSTLDDMPFVYCVNGSGQQSPGTDPIFVVNWPYDLQVSTPDRTFQAVHSLAAGTSLSWSSEDPTVLRDSEGQVAAVSRVHGCVVYTPTNDSDVPGPDKPTVYISGPMRGYPMYNFPSFDRMEKKLRACGYNVINPARIDRDEGFDPAADQVTDDHKKKFISRDLMALQALHPERGDGILMLPKSHRSTGALAEYSVAKWLGLNFYYEIDGKFHCQKC